MKYWRKNIGIKYWKFPIFFLLAVIIKIMGAILSTLIYQPLLLGTAATLMIIALIYQAKVSTCGKDTDNWGSEIFKINMGV